MCIRSQLCVCLWTNVFVLHLDRGRFSQSWSDPTHSLLFPLFPQGVQIVRGFNRESGGRKRKKKLTSVRVSGRWVNRGESARWLEKRRVIRGGQQKGAVQINRGQGEEQMRWKDAEPQIQMGRHFDKQLYNWPTTTSNNLPNQKIIIVLPPNELLTGSRHVACFLV